MCACEAWTEFIPKLLTKQQKEFRVEIAQDMLDCANNDVEFTMTQIFWPKTIRHLCNSLFTLLIWHHATSGYYGFSKFVGLAIMPNLRGDHKKDRRPAPDQKI